jgi:hypothetical protein
MATAAVPKVIKNFNLFVDGVGYAGLVDSVSLPDIELTVEDHRAGGMDGSIPLDLGMEPIEMSFELAEHSRRIFEQFGLQNQAAVALTFRSAMVDDDTVIPYVINARGMFTSASLGEVSNGQKNPLSVTIKLRYFRLEQASVELWEIDVLNMIRKIAGVDQLAAQRAAIGM